MPRVRNEARVINSNGAWCWFQDERALIDSNRGLLVVGSVAAEQGPQGAERSGNIEVTVVELATGQAHVRVLHERLEADDHNAPALYLRSDGSWLAAYTTHKHDDFTRWRISAVGDPTNWGPEQTFDWSAHTGGIGITYSNLYHDGEKLYCFARAVNDDPCALVSVDEGATWEYAGQLLTRPKVGYVNGYTRYATQLAGGVAERIDFITTDHHPRDYNNSIYHGYLQAGALHDSTGRVVNSAVLDPRSQNSGGPAPATDQAELTTVLAARTQLTDTPLTHCWTSDLRRLGGELAATITARGIDELTDPAQAFERYRPVLDHRFIYARLSEGGHWQTHELAHAGPGYLPHEQDYTGLATIDPYDLNSVYISTPIDPRTGTTTSCYEIYWGTTSDRGHTWHWEAITEGSSVDNLRPIVAVGDPSRIPLLWFRGEMAKSQDYNCEIVLLDLKR